MGNSAGVIVGDSIWMAFARSVTWAVRFVERKVRDWTRPDRAAPLLLELTAGLTRSNH